MATFDSPRLLADIGGTHARFALETAPGAFTRQATLRCADHADFHAAVRAYLDGLDGLGGLGGLPAGRAVRHAAVAIANPVDGDDVRMTHCPWAFSIEAERQRLALDTLLVVNDFTALAMALPRLGAEGLRQVGGGQARPRSVMGLLGSGTGLGMSVLVPAGEAWVALASEGGHAAFAPRDERELAILRHAGRQFDPVSTEHLLSGPGLALGYRALAEGAGQPLAPADTPAATEIVRRALAGGDALAAEALEAFCTMLGTAAANLALTLGAFGGLYIAGGIVPRLGAAFDRSGFRARFEDQGRFSACLTAIPTFVVTAPEAAWLGVSAILDAQLRARPPAPGDTLLAQIRRACSTLSPAERRVAEQVLAQPRTVLNQPIAAIARAARVSQPTVIRFCRSLGCAGLSDFKLRLASSLTGTLPIGHVQVTHDDSTLALGTKVLDNTAAAVLQMRGQLHREMIDRAIDRLRQARRVEFCTVGAYGAVAQDAQFKFLRFGIPAGAHTDPRMQLLAVGVLQPGDVAVVISADGRPPELLEVAARARERGATVIAITTSHSPLARQADTVLAVDQVEDAATQLPMVSRILQLLVVDILTVGLAMRRAPGAVAAAEAAGDAGTAEPALPTLAHMTLHSR